MSRFDFIDQINLEQSFEEILLSIENKKILGELFYPQCIWDCLLCGNFDEMILLKNLYLSFWDVVNDLENNHIHKYKSKKDIFDMESIITGFFRMNFDIDSNIINWNIYIKNHKCLIGKYWKPNYDKYSIDYEKKLQNEVKDKSVTKK